MSHAEHRPRICLVEDDAIMGESLCDRFRLEGFEVDWMHDRASASRALSAHDYDVVVSDVRLPDGGGDALYRDLFGGRKVLPPFIFITGYGTIDGAVSLLKLGAVDYLTKPFDLESLVGKLRALCVPARAPGSDAFGISPPMRAIAEQLPRLSQHAATVLITGESGVGKEHIARAVHDAIPHSAERPFIAVNCGAIAESIMESELFGHERGAFTGAIRAKRGYFEQAQGGTLFLDEIGDMPLGMQAKVLRIVQERSLVRVGGERSISVDFRLVVATHRDLRKLSELGQFREDLYYRLNVVHVRVPPLRERAEDILWFARQFVRDYVNTRPNEPRSLHPLTEQALRAYPWPGNVRELRHCIERACILSRSPVIAPEACFDDAVNPHQSVAAISGNLGRYLQECERSYILAALERQSWQIGRSAEILGISRKNLWEKMRKLGISEQHVRSESDSR